jgi:excisionase family DNA binding protein
MIEDKLMNLREAGYFLNVKKETVRKWVKQGKIKTVRISTRGDMRFTPQAIEEFLTGYRK